MTLRICLSAYYANRHPLLLLLCVATLQSPRSLDLCISLSHQCFFCQTPVKSGFSVLLITRPSGCRVQTSPSKWPSVACLQNQNRVKTNRQNESLKQLQPASPAAAGFSLASASRELAEFFWMYGHEPAAAAVTRRRFNILGAMGGFQRIQPRELLVWAWQGLGDGLINAVCNCLVSCTCVLDRLVGVLMPNVVPLRHLCMSPQCTLPTPCQQCLPTYICCVCFPSAAGDSSW
jgi:hypothetical protein